MTLGKANNFVNISGNVANSDMGIAKDLWPKQLHLARKGRLARNVGWIIQPDTN